MKITSIIDQIGDKIIINAKYVNSFIFEKNTIIFFLKEEVEKQ